MMKLCRVVFNVEDDFIVDLREFQDRKTIYNRNQRNYVPNDEKLYTYKTFLEDLEVGDRVVVQVRDSYTLATFVEYVETLLPTVPKGVEMKLVVDYVDFSRFDEFKDKEVKMLELKAQMEMRKEKLEEITIYKMLSEQDGEMKKLLEEYNELNK